MSLRVLVWAAGRKCKTPIERSILWALADMAKERGATVTCWPSQKTLAKRALCSERSVQRSLLDFEERGWIARSRRARKAGSRSSDKIELLVSGLPATVAGSQPATDDTSYPPPLRGRTYQEESIPSREVVGSMAGRDLLTAVGVSEERADELMAAFAIRHRRVATADDVEPMIRQIANGLDRNGEAVAIILRLQTRSKPERVSVDDGEPGGRGEIAGLSRNGDGALVAVSAAAVLAAPKGMPGMIEGEPLVSIKVDDDFARFERILDVWKRERGVDLWHWRERKAALIPLAILTLADSEAPPRARGPPRG